MPQLENAKKALRQSKKQYEVNKIIRAEIDSTRRKFRKLLEAKKFDEAKAMMPEIQKKLDKAVKNNIFKKNKGSRIISRMATKLTKATVK